MIAIVGPYVARTMEKIDNAPIDGDAITKGALIVGLLLVFVVGEVLGRRRERRLDALERRVHNAALMVGECYVDQLKSNSEVLRVAGASMSASDELRRELEQLRSVATKVAERMKH